MFFLTGAATHFQLPSVVCVKYGKKYKPTSYLIDKDILGNMGGVYVTYVADVDKEQ